MNNLKVINYKGIYVTDSREVAKMTERDHNQLMRSIRGYIKILDQSAKLHTADFFIESTYKNENNQSYPCYLLTKQGCEMVANKMTGEKGILFTAEYVQAFNKMENYIEHQENNKPTCIEDVLIQSLQEMKAIRNEVQALKTDQQETKESIQGIRDVVALTPNAWRKDTTNLISKIAKQLGGFEHIKDVREESYKLLNETFKVDVKRRLTNKKKNMALEGVGKSKIDKLNVLDVIAEDSKLINGYISVVSKMAIKYGVA